jgi:acyl CoA:acetate/3-ketoacid CoA transferase alpha subunit
MKVQRAEHGTVYLHQEVNGNLPEDMILAAGGITTGDNQYTLTSEILNVGITALTAYKAEQGALAGVSGANITAQSYGLSVLGNVGNSPIALFKLDKNESVHLDLINSEGNVVGSIASGMYSQGIHSVAINVEGLPNGAYFARLTSLSGNLISRLLVVK